MSLSPLKVFFTLFVFWGGAWTCLRAEEPAPVQLPKPVEDVAIPVADQAGESSPARDPSLEAFLEEFTDHPLREWTAGKIWSGSEWMRYDQFATQGDRWHEVYRYQREREKREDTFRDHLFLADGCRAHKLFAEERAHLTRALMFDYSFHEAHQRLGHLNFGGFWMSPRQVHLALREISITNERLNTWGKELQRQHKLFARTKPGSVAEQKAAAELMKIRTPDAIPAFERYFASHGRRESALFQNWLARIDSHEAAAALVRQSVFHEDAELRTHAAGLLKDRRWDQYVPYALSGMTTVSTRLNLELVEIPLRFPVPPLRVLNKQVVVDGPDTRLTVNGKRTILRSEQIKSPIPTYVSSIGSAAPAAISEQVLRDAYSTVGDVILRNYGQQALESTQQVRVDRISRLLQKTTEQEIEKPDDWFDWWRQQNDIEMVGGKFQLQDQYDDGVWFVDNRRVTRTDRVSILQVPPTSCFVAGTIVETERGQRPIEQLQTGDRVLSQDIETGELALKPVLLQTKRQQVKTVALTVDGDEFQCSIGHPFWVAHKGWRMAQELETGMEFYSLDGSVKVLEDIREGEVEPVYNIVVSDFSTYFVGKQKVLTHDVTPRSATDSILPGIRKSFD